MKRLVYLLYLLILFFGACQKNIKEPSEERNPDTFGIIGDWYSAGDNVSVYMDTVYGVDSIFVSFYADSTYRIKRFGDNSMRVFEGNYSQYKTDVDSIWSISLNEQKPVNATLQGIFSVTTVTTPYELTYEVFQVEPSIGFEAPTPEAGFGSTGNGALQGKNIQRYLQMP